MSDAKSDRPDSDRIWSVPVAVTEVPESGRHFDLVADEHRREAIARLAAVTAVPRLEASFDLSRYGRNGLHVVGRVAATVDQTCVVTLEPIENEIEASIDLVFSSAAVSPPDDVGEEIEIPVEDGPELLVDGMVDLGAIATEFLILAIDPYPRKPDTVFEPPAAGDDTAHPFAALATLKKRQEKGQI
jgi:uncharacterized metal-binding protein YceD (DUF177 family)